MPPSAHFELPKIRDPHLKTTLKIIETPGVRRALPAETLAEQIMIDGGTPATGNDAGVPGFQAPKAMLPTTAIVKQL